MVRNAEFLRDIINVTTGHTQGLVQILNKCDYEGYIFCRPMDWIFELPKMVFDWVGFDGSKVKAARFQDATIYCSELGNAVNAIKRKIQPWEKEDIAFALWGVGNHGGGIHTKALCAQFLSSWGWCKKGNECDNSF